jgi:hypothetical protein
MHSWVYKNETDFLYFYLKQKEKNKTVYVSEQWYN